MCPRFSAHSDGYINHQSYPVEIQGKYKDISTGKQLRIQVFSNMRCDSQRRPTPTTSETNGPRKDVEKCHKVAACLRPISEEYKLRNFDNSGGSKLKCTVTLQAFSSAVKGQSLK